MDQGNLSGLSLSGGAVGDGPRPGCIGGTFAGFLELARRRFLVWPQPGGHSKNGADRASPPQSPARNTEAEQDIRELLTLIESLEHHFSQAILWRAIGNLQRKQNQVSEARNAYERACEFYRAIAMEESANECEDLLKQLDGASEV